jgi:hypothetical protein
MNIGRVTLDPSKEGDTMLWRRIVAVIASIVLVSGCSLPQGMGGDGGQEQDPTAGLQTQVAGAIASTAAAETALANALAGTLAAMATNTPESTLTPTLTSTETSTATPSFTFTASFTPSATITLTPSSPMVSVTAQTNCRSGPGKAYDILGVLNVGETAEVVGRNYSSDTWIIKLPSNPSIICWLWGFNATVIGNSAGLPVSTPPFTPTPSANFTVTYWGIETCGGGMFGIKFQIVNTGSVTWESYQVAATDQVTTTTYNTGLNKFLELTQVGCALINEPANAAPGQTVYASTSLFGINPSGHAYQATFKLCSLDFWTGTCMEKTINFTP